MCHRVERIINRSDRSRNPLPIFQDEFLNLQKRSICILDTARLWDRLMNPLISSTLLLHCTSSRALHNGALYGNGGGEPECFARCPPPEPSGAIQTNLLCYSICRLNPLDIGYFVYDFHFSSFRLFATVFRVNFSWIFPTSTFLSSNWSEK